MPRRRSGGAPGATLFSTTRVLLPSLVVGNKHGISLLLSGSKSTVGSVQYRHEDIRNTKQRRESEINRRRCAGGAKPSALRLWTVIRESLAIALVAAKALEILRMGWTWLTSS